MEGHGIKMMVEVFGWLMMIINGYLVGPLIKEVQLDMLIWIMMENVKNGNYRMVLIGMMLETK